jgi:hypothetical protein
MRNGQNNKRMRGRNRKSHNPLTRVFESNGPDVKIRGAASHIAEKYVQLARDAQASGDPVAAENYYQHAEHYFRLIATAQEQFRQNQPNAQYYRPEGGGNDGRDEAFDDGDDDAGSQDQPPFGNPGGQGNQPAFGTRDPQPYLPRDAQFFSPRDQQQAARQAPPQNEDEGVDRLPSFITGGGASSQQASAGPQGQNGGYEGQGGADRFPLHRRRRRHRPRGEAPSQGGDAAAEDSVPQGSGD